MMKRFRFIFLMFSFILFGMLMSLECIEAYDLITAQEAYNMVSGGQASMIDVRTLEEYLFVGSPALEPGGDPIAYLISWKVFKGMNEDGTKKLIDNPDFDALVEQTFGEDKDQPLILMCACGIRSTFAAERLESLGYTEVYEIDNNLKESAAYPGGIGGFEGAGYNNAYGGYTGYPGRLDGGSLGITLETVSLDIDNENDSVSWMDTGLPVTKKADPDKIPKLEKTESQSEKKSASQAVMPYMIYPWLTNYTFQPAYPAAIYPSTLGFLSQGALSVFPYTLNLSNQFLSLNSNLFNQFSIPYPGIPSQPSVGGVKAIGSG
ncbi:MAG: rhodanese-like domain-containing protein [bacterium]